MSKDTLWLSSALCIQFQVIFVQNRQQKTTGDRQKPKPAGDYIRGQKLLHLPAGRMSSSLGLLQAGAVGLCDAVAKASGHGLLSSLKH